MNRIKKTFLTCFSFVSFCSFADDYIYPEQAFLFYGQNKTVCGKIVQAVAKKGYFFLNYGDWYPNQTFHLFITRPKKYNNLNQLQNKIVCAYGLIEMYKNKPQITDPIRITIIK